MAREYTDVDKHELLIKVAEHKGKTARASKATGVPQKTLWKWWDALTEDEREGFIIESRKRQEAYWQEIHDACLTIAREKVQEMSARDALVGAGISFDKLQLLRGQATGITSTVASDAESIAREVDNILSRVSDDASRKAIREAGEE